MDTGAPSSAIGMKELRRLSSLYGKQLFRLLRSFKQFRFAGASFTSLGRVDLPLATPSHFRPVFVTVDVVSADVPALLGLDVLEAESLVADTVLTRLTKRIVLRGLRNENGKLLEDTAVDDWSVPLQRYFSHVYVSFGFSSRTYFARTQLHKLHRQFSHPSAEKI